MKRTQKFQSAQSFRAASELLSRAASARLPGAPPPETISALDQLRRRSTGGLVRPGSGKRAKARSNSADVPHRASAPATAMRQGVTAANGAASPSSSLRSITSIPEDSGSGSDGDVTERRQSASSGPVGIGPTSLRRSPRPAVAQTPPAVTATPPALPQPLRLTRASTPDRPATTGASVSFRIKSIQAVGSHSAASRRGLQRLHAAVRLAQGAPEPAVADAAPTPPRLAGHAPRDATDEAAVKALSGAGGGGEASAGSQSTLRHPPVSWDLSRDPEGTSGPAGADAGAGRRRTVSPRKSAAATAQAVLRPQDQGRGGGEQAPSGEGGGSSPDLTGASPSAAPRSDNATPSAQPEATASPATAGDVRAAVSLLQAQQRRNIQLQTDIRLQQERLAADIQALLARLDAADAPTQQQRDM